MRATRTPPELIFAVGFACGILTLGIVRTILRDDDVELFRSVRDLALTTHVEEHEARHLLDDALAGMLAGLDRYSKYYPPAEIEALERETSGEYRGVGVLFQDTDRGVIRFALPGSPAERAGLRPGDRFLQVDGEWVADLPSGGLREHLRRRDGTPIEVEVEDRGGDRRNVSLTPAYVGDPSVRHARILDEERGIGYAALTSFTSRTPEEFDTAIAWLQEQGARALVLDVRANPGGVLDAALRIADRFVEDGVLVSTRSRTETRSTSATARVTDLLGMPLVLLVDGDSASASEILCGALQDHRAAVVVGEPTYGKGAVQTLTRYDEARIKITTSHYFTPAGRRIESGTQRAGLAPDVLVELDPLERRPIHSYLGTYSPPPDAVAELRSWENEEGIVLLPPPPEDPQLAVALDLLRGEAPDLVAHEDAR